MKREKKKKRANRSLRHCIASRCILFLSLVRRASADIVMMNESVSGRTCAGECASAETRQKKKRFLSPSTANDGIFPSRCLLYFDGPLFRRLHRPRFFIPLLPFFFTLFGIHFHRPFFLLSFSYIYTTMSTWACRRTSTHQFADSARNGCRRHFIVSRV